MSQAKENASPQKTDHRDGTPTKAAVHRTFTLDDFDIGKPLGRGKFGNVYLAREKKSKFIVALKARACSLQAAASVLDARCELQVLFKSQLQKSGVEHQVPNVCVHSVCVHSVCARPCYCLKLQTAASARD